MTTVGSQIPRLLAAHGVDTVFGIPGVQTLELFRGISAAGLAHVLNRSEQGASFAADGYARTTGRPGVCLLISGPGLTNAATGIAQAYHDSVPLLVISAAPPRDAAPGSGALHQLPDQHALMQTLTAASHHVDDPAELPRVLAEAFASFRAGRPRPVHVELPADVLQADVAALQPLETTAARPHPGEQELAAAAEILSSAAMPAILAGGGAAGAGDELLAVAQRLGAPVALTLNGKGVLPDSHPLSLSTTLPSPATLDLLDDADVVLLVGTELSDVDVYYAGRRPALDRRVVRIDIDPAQMARPRDPDVALVSDSRRALAALRDRLPTRGDGHPAGTERAARARSSVRWWPRATPLLPLVATVGRALPEDAIVACDSTQLAYIGQHVWAAERPRSWMVPAGWGTLGHALPMAVGAAMAAPDRPVACVVGDGGLLFTAGELATAADLERQFLMLLWNNRGYQEMRDEYLEAGIPDLGTNAAARDYGAIARGFGWEAVKPATRHDVSAAIRRALATDGPVLVELTPDAL